ncbi:hypothetical protein BDV25DRAFT_162331 [Aspergillus avenaceus]|uniref:FHA domain-containing protein n=1 Tax=Aspergillus avenaceus TaxID=36643 RepID=A0A5N6TJJ6_ASPAV|nr:hypothetical protein BDV25DRAFT_162331 [Aspergillus avenaceus]
MPGFKAIVTLYPVNISDNLPYRSLTFTSKSDYVTVGRASKRERKNLLPKNHNALFDSRVMSRNHAKLRVCPDTRVVYINDNGSMHGTFVEGKKVPDGQDIAIKSGDVVVFGTEVIRGHETFPPLKVRTVHQWFESDDIAASDHKVSVQPKQATNTFCVPEDDDDYDTDIVHESGPTKEIIESSCESVGSDSEDSSIMELSSPLTSPPKCGDLLGSEQSPIDLDSQQAEQPLATPRMTPPTIQTLNQAHGKEPDQDVHIICDSDHRSTQIWSDEENSVSEASDFDHERRYFCADDIDSEDDSMSRSSLEFDMEETGSVTNSVELNPSPLMGVLQGPSKALDRSDYDMSNYSAKYGHFEERNTVEHSQDLSGHIVTNCRVELPMVNPGSANMDVHKTSVPYLQPSGKVFDHSLAGFPCDTYTPTVEWQPPSQDPAYILHAHAAYRPVSLQDPYSPRIPYKDGPFVNSLTNIVDDSNRVNSLAPVPLKHACVDVEKPEIRTDAVTKYDQVDLSSCHLDRALEDEQHARLPLLDVGKPPLEASAAPRPSLKRKAVDMESDSHVENDSNNQKIALPTSVDLSIETRAVENDDSYLPDAQPQPTAPGVDDTSLQLSEMHDTQNYDRTDASSPAESERPVKRLKTSQSGKVSFKSHATTAAFGAVVGAIGTIAVLASLPADYFA